MPRLIASKSFRYATRQLRAGDPFDASDADARILLRIGRATEPADMPDDMGGVVIPADGEPTRRRYRRRDMRAED